MAAKVDSELGRKIYPQRFAVAEPVFANIRTQKRLDRFTQGKGQGKYPMALVLHDSQYREDRKLWLHLSENTAEDDS